MIGTPRLSLGDLLMSSVGGRGDVLPDARMMGVAQARGDVPPIGGPGSGLGRTLASTLAEVPDASGPKDPAAPPAVSGKLRPDYAALLSQAMGPRPELRGIRKVAAILGPALMAAGGNMAGANAAIESNFGPMRDWDRQNREALFTAAKWSRDDDLEDAKRSEPQYFSGSEDRVRYDPVTGQSTRVYDAPQDFEDYARAQNYDPGTPEYAGAVEDYVLRGNGPTAFQYDQSLEAVRNANRLALRGTPTYRDLNPPPPRSSGGGGRGHAGPRPPSISSTIAPILDKVAKGQPLTPGEQQAWGMYRPTRGVRGGSRPPVSAATGTVPSAAPPAKPPPPVGTVVQGHRFRGGNPKDRANWVRVK